MDSRHVIIAPVVLFLLLSAGIPLAASQVPVPPSPRAARQPRGGSAMPVAKIPVIAPATNSVAGPITGSVHPYQSAGRRDPFLSLVYEAIQARKASRGLSLMPLERYGLSQIALVAIVSGPGIPSYALVGLPNGKHYVLKCGSVVGTNKGRVISIAPDHLVVRETVTDLTGRKITRETVLKLRVQEEQ